MWEIPNTSPTKLFIKIPQVTRDKVIDFIELLIEKRDGEIKRLNKIVSNGIKYMEIKNEILEEFGEEVDRFEFKFGFGGCMIVHRENDTPLVIPNPKEYIKDLIKSSIDTALERQRGEDCAKWKALAEAMDNAPVGHRVVIKKLLGEDEWTLTRRNK